MQSLVSLSYLPDTMLCLSFSFSVGVAAADSSSFHCIQLQLLWRLLFVLHFLICSSPTVSISLSTHTFFRTVPILCIFSSSSSSFTLFWCTHVALVAFLFVSLAFHLPCCCCCCCVHFLCYFFSFTLLCRFVRSFVLLRWISTCQTSIKRVCVCRNATGNGSRRGGGDCYQIGCCTLLHFSSAAISNWLGIGLVSS